MKRSAALLAAGLWMMVPLGAWASTGVSGSDESARLGFRRIRAGASPPELILAQRTIDRDWGPSDDSIYVEVDVPGWKSEPLATSLSAVIPGTGQAYLGERGSAFMYLAIEAASWSGWLWYRHDADKLNHQAEGLAGVPTDPASGWSYDRWMAASGGDPADLSGLYAVDREAYLTVIGSDPRYAGGWSSGNTHGDFLNLRGHADTRLKNSRLVATGLWVNHLISAATALRSARLHNMPLSHNLGMRVVPRIRNGRAGVMVTMWHKF